MCSTNRLPDSIVFELTEFGDSHITSSNNLGFGSPIANRREL